ncbi:MAG TPA: bifunctional diaminohydroxyphosphoribosylaminopyrimidine deaminase/5-amino-6-(5-phosphoribosylamino)uracil reductase RibD [Myxococcota bacterium]|nr:bifunctional diaminohydroxyphosphoribosylaminopyrimidine deaminase/5-amino-6-(5-phosphoribosylamino)uracil reductase RibD [Myxococcota bacterium]
MRLALAQARRALGRSFPNPAVGAVVFRGDRVLGRGFTQPPGGPHAEIVALERAVRRHGRASLRGASLAVTLEPCCHQGRTGPCTDAVLAAGVGRVFVGHVDPHPAVRGGGVRRLRRAGIPVRVGVLEEACRVQHRGFLSRVERGRPFVTLKLAASLDGRIATGRGESRWITGERARAHVHRLRAESDAVMIGSASALADDPELTARRGVRVVHRPVRVLVDSRLRVPTSARLYRADATRTWVLCGRAAPPRRRRAVEATGARVLEVPMRPGGLRLDRALERLAAEGLGSVLVEGGGGLAAALVRDGLVDELVWLAAPRLLGAEGRPAIGPLGVGRLAAAPALAIDRVRRLGPDLWIQATPLRPAGAGR